MYTYSELLSKFQRSTNSNKDIYKIENNTYVMKGKEYSNYENEFSIILHGSYIAKIAQDTIVLDNNNYQTMTTKDRLNKILHDNQVNYRIYQDHFTWFVYPIHYYPNWYYKKDDRIEFYNGITFIYCLNRLHGNGWYINGYVE